jgi:hypothetical protein
MCSPEGLHHNQNARWPKNLVTPLAFYVRVPSGRQQLSVDNIKTMTAGDINQRLRDIPFHPSRIHLSNGSSIPLMDSAMVLVGETSVIVPAEMGCDSQGFPLVKRRRTIVLAHMVQFSDIDEQVGGRHRKRK